MHFLTSKVLPPFTAAAKSPIRSSAGGTNSQTAALHNTTQSATSDHSIKRRSSLNDALVDAVVEQLSNGMSPTNAPLKSQAQYLNGSAHRGKSPYSNEPLKKSNSSRM